MSGEINFALGLDEDLKQAQMDAEKGFLVEADELDVVQVTLAGTVVDNYSHTMFHAEVTTVVYEKGAGTPSTPATREVAKTAAQNVSEELFGRALTDQEFADIVGAPGGGRVDVETNETEGVISLYTEHPGYIDGWSIRSVFLNVDGRLYMDNESLKVARAGERIGTRMFARQAYAAKRLGVKVITTFAKGNPKSKHYNGYYTWALLGYNIRISLTKQKQLIADGFQPATETHDLFAQKGGREWWQENGIGANGEFDLSDDSKSFKMLEDYLREEGININDYNGRGLEEN